MHVAQGGMGTECLQCQILHHLIERPAPTRVRRSSLRRRSGYSTAMRSVSRPVRTRGLSTVRSTGSSGAASGPAVPAFTDNKYTDGAARFALKQLPRAGSEGEHRATAHSRRFTSATRRRAHSTRRAAAKDFASKRPREIAKIPRGVPALAQQPLELGQALTGKSRKSRLVFRHESIQVIRGARQGCRDLPHVGQLRLRGPAPHRWSLRANPPPRSPLRAKRAACRPPTAARRATVSGRRSLAVRALSSVALKARTFSSLNT